MCQQQDNGIDPSLAGMHIFQRLKHYLIVTPFLFFVAWTISILGLGSMIGTIGTGYLCTIIKPKYVLMGIYGLRAVLIVIVVFIPMSVTTVIIFSVFFGVS